MSYSLGSFAKNYSGYNNIKKAIETGNFDYTDIVEEIWGWYEKPLSDFLPMENQLLEI